MKCPKCAEEAGSGRFCRSCGVALAASAPPPQAGSVCPFCGADVRPGTKFCASCAAPLGQATASPAPAAATTICVNCGTEVKADTKFCKSCGKAVGSGAPTVTPDLMPTAMTASPVPAASPPPAAPSPLQASPVMKEPARSIRPPAAVPRLVAKGEAPGLASATAAQPGGSNKMLILASVAVLVLVAAGAVYKFVLHKPVPQSAPAVESAVESPAVAQPTTPAPAESNPVPANADSQPPAGADAQQPPETTATDAAPAGNSATTGNAVPAPGRVPKRPPAKPSGSGYAQSHANAEQAMAASQYLNPPDSSGLFWARKAKSQGDPGAAQIEQEIFTRQLADIAAARQSHSYEQAQAQLYQLASSFPEHAELRQMQDDIHQEQQHYTQQLEDQRRQAELQTQTKKFAVQHRHGAGGNFCTGIITISPGGAKYDCDTADSGGRCEHVTFGSGSLKEVKVRGDGSLHVATRQQGNFDFSGGEFAIKDAAAALGLLVKH
jgi:hypothetical protein